MLTYCSIARHQLGNEDFNKFISLKPDFADAYRYQGVAYFLLGKNLLGYSDAQKTCSLENLELLEWAKDHGRYHLSESAMMSARNIQLKSKTKNNSEEKMSC